MNAPADWIVPKRIVASPDTQCGPVRADLHLVCGVGPYELDVLVRELVGPWRLEVIGQVTLGDSLHEPVSELPLRLVEARTKTVADTKTDDFGEFDIGSDATGCYGLRLGEDSDAPCVLVWEGANA